MPFKKMNLIQMTQWIMLNTKKKMEIEIQKTKVIQIMTFIIIPKTQIRTNIRMTNNMTLDKLSDFIMNY